jgi:hypothetical protein
MPMDVLYKTHSIISTSFREQPIRVDWRFFMRSSPLKHYHELIYEYNYLEDDDLDWVRERVDGFLCKPEVDWLREYLDKKFSVKLEIEELSLPVKYNDLFLLGEDLENRYYLDQRMVVLSKKVKFEDNIHGFIVRFPFEKVNTVEDLLSRIDCDDSKEEC